MFNPLSINLVILLLSTIIVPSVFFYLIWIFKYKNKRPLKFYFAFSIYLGIVIFFFIHIFKLFDDFRILTVLEILFIIFTLGLFSNFFTSCLQGKTR